LNGSVPSRCAWRESAVAPAVSPRAFSSCTMMSRRSLATLNAASANDRASSASLRAAAAAVSTAPAKRFMHVVELEALEAAELLVQSAANWSAVM
jgi:hypothetical protein